MERKSKAQIREQHSFNHPGSDEMFLADDCDRMMQQYADQEMALFSEWANANFFLVRNGVWEAIEEDNEYTTQQLLTIYKEQNGRKEDT